MEKYVHVQAAARALNDAAQSVLRRMRRSPKYKGKVECIPKWNDVAIRTAFKPVSTVWPSAFMSALEVFVRTNRVLEKGGAIDTAKLPLPKNSLHTSLVILSRDPCVWSGEFLTSSEAASTACMAALVQTLHQVADEVPKVREGASKEPEHSRESIFSDPETGLAPYPYIEGVGCTDEGDEGWGDGRRRYDSFTVALCADR